MTDYLTSFSSLFFSDNNQLIVMFLSAFLSATVLPGNSEIMFTALASQTIYQQGSFYSLPLLELLFVATVGNSLGSAVTYGMGMLLPKPPATEKKAVQWALEKSEKYGAAVLLFSWLPVVGDIFCGIAGWLRFPALYSLIFIVIGKLLRYLIVLVGLYPVLKYVA